MRSTGLTLLLLFDEKINLYGKETRDETNLVVVRWQQDKNCKEGRANLVSTLGKGCGRDLVVFVR